MYVNSDLRIPFISASLFNGRMKTIEEIRWENLCYLIEKHGGVTRFADLVGSSQSQISQLKNRSPDSKTGKQKKLGSAQAREMEDKLGFDRGWMDHDHTDREYEHWLKIPKEVREYLIRQANQGNKQANGQ